MRTKRIKLFSYPELSNRAKVKALDSYIQNNMDMRVEFNEGEILEQLINEPISKESAVFTKDGQFIND